MSRYPGTVWKPIAGTSKTRLTKDLLCFHTMVGYLKSTWTYFNRVDVYPYSHFGIGGVWGSDAAAGLDGVTWQMADTDYRGAANLDGNWRCISVETADNAARPIAKWTPKQCDAIVNIMVQAHLLDGIPLVIVPDSKPGRRGVAYHRMGCDPYRVAGGERWSQAYGKDCPTDVRIRQLPDLVARARDIVAYNNDEEDTLASLDDDEKRRLMRAVDNINGGVAPGQASFAGTVRATLQTVQSLTNQVRTLTAVTGDDEANVIAKLGEVEQVLVAKMDATPSE